MVRHWYNWRLVICLLLVVPVYAGEPPNDRHADSSLEVRYVEQNWSPQESLDFYSIQQGSPLIRKAFFDALEQPESQALFRDSDYLASFGFLKQHAHDQNPDGYPVGIVANVAIEVNCALCHTSRMVHNNVEYRIDGSQAVADAHAWLDALTKTLELTLIDAVSLDSLKEMLPTDEIVLDQQKKFGRFAKRIFKSDTARVSQLYPLVYMLERDYARRQRYNDYNHFGKQLSSTERSSVNYDQYGFGRLDALGAILNQACAEDLDNAENASPADAPVNYPSIWDAPQHSHVQWNGAVDNKKRLGPLGRNAGQVIGVFGLLETDGDEFIGYDSSIRFDELEKAEKLITTLWSPKWPAEFGLDLTLVARGKQVYEESCSDCHALMNRTDPSRNPRDVLVPIKGSWNGYPELGTDPRTASNFLRRQAKVGVLAGRFKGAPFGPRFPLDRDTLVPAREILSHVVARSIVRSFVPWREELTIDSQGNATEMFLAPEDHDSTLMVYKARPLNGVWSTAPYLHNGSVLNMVELLTPASRRPQFKTGTVEYDPSTMGFLDEGTFTFDTTSVGNSNKGHTYGAHLQEADKKALLEFIKTL
jgi:hypothetical protein